MSFQDSRLKDMGFFTINSKKGSYLLSCDNKEVNYKALASSEKKDFEKQVRAEKVTLIPLPDVRELKYLFKTAEGDDYLYVDTPKYREGTDYHLYVGKLGSMKQIKVKSVDVVADGGTVNIKTEDGRLLHSPSRFARDHTPKWTGKTLIIMNHKFDLKVLGLPSTAVTVAALHTPCDKFFEAP